MRKSRFTEEQIIGTLKENEAGAKAEERRRVHGLSGTTYQMQHLGRQRVGRCGTRGLRAPSRCRNAHRRAN